MLILHRKDGERVLLVLPDGRELVVTVVRRAHGGVRLGFDTPRDVKVVRQGPAAGWVQVRK